MEIAESTLPEAPRTFQRGQVVYIIGEPHGMAIERITTAAEPVVHLRWFADMTWNQMSIPLERLQRTAVDFITWREAQGAKP